MCLHVASPRDRYQHLKNTLPALDRKHVAAKTAVRVRFVLKSGGPGPAGGKCEHIFPVSATCEDMRAVVAVHAMEHGVEMEPDGFGLVVHSSKVCQDDAATLQDLGLQGNELVRVVDVERG